MTKGVGKTERSRKTFLLTKKDKKFFAFDLFSGGETRNSFARQRRNHYIQQVEETVLHYRLVA